MNKKGFVFIESVIVLVVVALALTTLLLSYSMIARKTKEKEYYDRASDKYTLYSISKLGVNTKYNYSRFSNIEVVTESCSDTKYSNSLNKIFPNNSCEKVFKNANLKYLYIVDNVGKALDSADGYTKYDNGTIEYMKTLKKCKTTEDCKATGKNAVKYLIGVFYRNDKYFFAAIEI